MKIFVDLYIGVKKLIKTNYNSEYYIIKLMRLFLGLSPLLSVVSSLQILSPSLKLPMVEGLSYTEVYNLWKGFIDINYFVSADVYGGYETNLF